VDPSLVPEPERENPGLPSEEEEASMLLEQKNREGALPPTPKRKASEPDAETLRGKAPELADLVERIPGPVRETLEELFRAKFTGVKRVAQAQLK
jgi:hypothetical protein